MKPGNWLADNLPGWLPKKIPNLQPFWVILTPPGQPDKKRLLTVQDFFKYTEEEGQQSFNPLLHECLLRRQAFLLWQKAVIGINFSGTMLLPFDNELYCSEA